MSSPVNAAASDGPTRSVCVCVCLRVNTHTHTYSTSECERGVSTLDLRRVAVQVGLGFELTTDVSLLC